MPIYLEPPGRATRGPDGQGWNRITLGAYIQPRPQCALRPTTYATLYEAMTTTQRARWGAHGVCDGAGACISCPRLAERTQLRAFTDSVLIRDDADGRLWLVNRPEDGWGSRATRVSWEYLARLDGWTIGRRHHDEHSAGFWLHRADCGDGAQ
jgi:hypothetical protein